MFIKTFSQISKKDVGIAGGKGASLGEMTRAGLPVPGGFVVLAGAFDRFLEETEIDADIEALLKKVNHNEVNSVDKASAEIRDLIMDEKVPADLQKEITEAYNQLFKKSPTSPNPSSGRRGIKTQISVAVVVQKMVQSEVSGISFTVHPVTKDKNQMVVEAGFGLGEAIVGGMVTPDTYIIHKNDFSILDINVSEQTFAIVRSEKGNRQQALGNRQ